MPNPISQLTWCIEKGYIACGGDNGMQSVLKLEFGKADSQSTLSMNQALPGHSGTIQICVWNEVHQKLTTCDDKGLIIVWTMQGNKWYEEMINNRNKSVIKDIKWSSNGEKVCIVYEDGNVIVGSVEGDRLWGKDLDHGISVTEWSPDGRLMLMGTPTGEIKVYDYLGNYLFPLKMCSQISDGSSLLAILWFDSSNCTTLPDNYSEIFPTLCIVYENGKVQLMKSESDDSPILFDVGLKIKCARWFPQGSVLAFGGFTNEDTDKKHEIRFYTSKGILLHVLKLSNPISSFGIEGNGMRMALGIQNEILFANVQYDYLFTYFNGTLVYAYQKSERQD